MNLKTISIAIGIMAGSAGLTNSGYNIYKNFVVEPGRNVEYNKVLLTQEPLIIEMVEIQPDPGMSMNVEVTVKIFKTGDILVESGSKREIIPFRMHTRTAMLDSLISSAWAQETVSADGKEYEVVIVKFIEKISDEGDNRQKRIRKFDDGTQETSIIDIRNNTVIETKTENIKLSEADKAALLKSPYKKKIFKPKSPE